MEASKILENEIYQDEFGNEKLDFFCTNCGEFGKIRNPRAKIKDIFSCPFCKEIIIGP